jgi:hypothetical protein
MKKILVILFWILPMLSKAQEISSCEVPADFAMEYQKQVQILALDVLWASGSEDTSSIRIPEFYTEPIMTALAGVYNSMYESEVDSIFRIYCINNQYVDSKGYRSDAIYVSLDTSVAWTSMWENEIDSSGHVFIDSLLAGIDYSVDLFFHTIVRIEFEEIINLKRLVSLLDTIHGVTFAEQTPAYGEGDKILHEQELHNHFFRFFLGWGDCPSGCTEARFWNFNADDQDCEVFYVSSELYSSNGIPQGSLHCLLSNSSLVKEDIMLTVFPNPATEVLHLSADKSIQRIELYDVTGALLYHMGFFSNEGELDISFLPQGIYFLKVNGEKMSRFVKGEE